MSIPSDRRTQSRKRPLSLVYVELPPSNGGMLRDLNEHGFCLRAMMPLHPSEKLAFSISLDNGVRIDGDAIVVRLEDKGRVAALEFAGLAAHSRDHIRRWLEKFEEPLSREASERKPPDAASATLEELRQQARGAIAGQAEAAKPVAPAPEPAAPAAKIERPLQPLPLLPQAGVSPPPEIESAPQAPAAVLPQAEVAEASLLPQVQQEFPPVQEPPAPPLDSPPEPQIEAEELPLPQFLRQPENAAPPPPAPKLPPLLTLSSVRPGPAAEPTPEPVVPAAHAPVAEPSPSPVEPPPAGNRVPLSEVLIQPPSVAAQASPPVIIPGVRRRVVPPPLEPLSPWESGAGAAPAGWMESFTLGRAIGIMVLIALGVGSYVYHREVGHALIWLGGQIAGDERRESPAATAAPVASPPVASPPAPQNSSAPASTSEAAAAPQQEAVSPEKKPTVAPVEIPAPPPTEPHRAADTASSDSSSSSGQSEYNRAMQILKTPSRKAELPEAVSLLWLAVRKNHVGAEITLAELYHQGRGVAKSCDQTRILLSAAARKGSPDAKKRLAEFEREICRD